MAGDRSWRTAFNAAFARLIEQNEPKEIRLFEDSLIPCFFSKPTNYFLKFRIYRNLMSTMYSTTVQGILGLQVCRTKYIDDLLEREIARGIQQLVILGAGLDTRAYRIPDADRIKVFEVDLKVIQDIKKGKIKKCLGELPSNIIFTPIDFNKQTLEEVLAEKGLDFSKPVFFIWEGVTQYITGEAVNNILSFISGASSGSGVVFTYILKSVIDGTSNIPGADTLMHHMEANGQTWDFGLEPSEADAFLKQFNLTLIEDVGVSYFQEKYLAPIGRSLEVSEIERVIYAKLM